MFSRTLAVVIIALTAATCAGLSRQAQSGSRNSITREEIAATHANTAYEAVQQLRPDFLRGRLVGSGTTAGTETPTVYLDGTRLGELQQLQSIPASIILTIQLISASDATTRWGTGHPAGVIEVRTRS